jgi:hypothetical protein
MRLPPPGSELMRHLLTKVSTRIILGICSSSSSSSSKAQQVPVSGQVAAAHCERVMRGDSLLQRAARQRRTRPPPPHTLAGEHEAG